MTDTSIRLNNDVMLVSFTGAQSSGKTTLLKRAKVDTLFRKWSFVPEVTRVVKRMGFKINELGGNETQLFILAEHLKNHHYSSNTMLDRCIIDGLVYTRHLCEIGKVDTWVYQYAKQLFDILIDKLDIIFYTDPNIPLVGDGERSVDVEFRKNIIKIFDEIMSLPKIMDKTVKLQGDACERYSLIKQTIQQHDKAR